MPQYLISIHLMLMLIIPTTAYWLHATKISIHLMLMLIFIVILSTVLNYWDFNTSHVNVNLFLWFNKYIFRVISIHLMLMLIHFWVCLPLCARISIHLMLMLILTTKILQTHLEHNFNTSHVNVNPILWFATLIFSSISIHLMLMLIVTGRIKIFLVINFNTSHVNVNPLNL